ncbi:hypothetical protein GJ496_007012 [Pomphorhynchus laevis]|nr:hypothetical protein GJ496_007012 [Pomphorhynchus laevis]
MKTNGYSESEESEQIRNSSFTTLEVKTKSVRQILSPLITQVKHLCKLDNIKYNKKVNNPNNYNTTLESVGKAVYDAILKFISTGSLILTDNIEIENEVNDACRQAELAGASILKLTSNCSDKFQKDCQALSLTAASQLLLSSITKLMILADNLNVQMIIMAKQRITLTLNTLSCINGKSDFCRKFGHYGECMVEFAKLTGERQSDLICDLRRCQLSALRTILEKTTLLILISCKNLLHHSDLIEARKFKDYIFDFVRQTLDEVQNIVVDSGCFGGPVLSQHLNRNYSNFIQSVQQIDLEAENLKIAGEIDQISESRIAELCTNLEQQSSIIADTNLSSVKIKEDLHLLHNKIRDSFSNVIRHLKDQQTLDGENKEGGPTKFISQMQSFINELKKVVVSNVLDYTSQVISADQGNALLNEIRMFALQGKRDLLKISLDKLNDQGDSLCECCRLLLQISAIVQLQVSCNYHETMFTELKKQLAEAAKCTALIVSKSHACQETVEMLDCMLVYWRNHISSFVVLLQEVEDVMSFKIERPVYFSLPRPGGHGNSIHTLEHRKDEGFQHGETLLQNQEKDNVDVPFNNSNDELLKRAKNMSNMAYAIYLFTQNRGPLKGINDIYRQTTYLCEEGVLLAELIFIENANDKNNNTKDAKDQQLVSSHDSEELVNCCHQLKNDVIRMMEDTSKHVDKQV